MHLDASKRVSSCPSRSTGVALQRVVLTTLNVGAASPFSRTLREGLGRVALSVPADVRDNDGVAVRRQNVGKVRVVVLSLALRIL